MKKAASDKNGSGKNSPQKESEPLPQIFVEDENGFEH